MRLPGKLLHDRWCSLRVRVAPAAVVCVMYGSYRGRLGRAVQLLSLVALCVLFAPTSVRAVQSGGFSVSGRVVDAASEAAIPGAVVAIESIGSRITDNEGSFLFRNVAPGRYGIVIEASGYRTVRTAVVITDDVTATLRLDPDPIPLDPIEAAGVVDLRGRVVETPSGLPVPYATVRVVGWGETSTNDVGAFRLPRLAPGEHLVEIERFGWVPSERRISVYRDTSVTAELQIDSVAWGLLRVQVEKLQDRIRSIGYPARTIETDEIRRSRIGDALELLKGRGGVTLVRCPGGVQPWCVRRGARPPVEPEVFIDDRRVHCGLEVLSRFPVAAIARVEIIRSGDAVRVYSTWFMERMSAGRVGLQPILPINWSPSIGGCV